MIDKGKIRPIVEGQTGQEVANNIKANFDYIADQHNANEGEVNDKLATLGSNNNMAYSYLSSSGKFNIINNSLSFDKVLNIKVGNGFQRFDPMQLPLPTAVDEIASSVLVVRNGELVVIRSGSINIDDVFVALINHRLNGYEIISNTSYIPDNIQQIEDVLSGSLENGLWNFGRISTGNLGDTLAPDIESSNFWKCINVKVKKGERYYVDCINNNSTNSKKIVITDNDYKIVYINNNNHSDRKSDYVYIKNDGHLIVNATALDVYEPYFYVGISASKFVDILRETHKYRQISEINKGNIIELQKMEIDSLQSQYDQCPIKVAYSEIYLAPINTAEHFLTAAKVGFNSLKADVALTKDNKLICCHDDGFTLNSEGRIIKYDTSNNTPIRQLNLSEILDYEYDELQPFFGYYTKPCTVDKFLCICKENGVIPFVTLRSIYTEETLIILLDLLRKYNLENKSIINIFPPYLEPHVSETSKCELIRKHSKTIGIGYTMAYGVAPTDELIDSLISFKPLFLGIETKLVMDNLSVVDYAKSNGLRMMAYDIRYINQFQEFLNIGFVGGQIKSPMFQYKRDTYSFNLTIREGGDKVKFNDLMESDRYEAVVNVDKQSHKVTIKNITTRGNFYGIPNGILPNWMYKLPADISARDWNYNAVPVKWDNIKHELIVSPTSFDDSDIIIIIVV